MQPDLLFVSTGLIALCLALGLALRALRHARKQDWLPALLWVGFAAGMLLQGWAPHLQIADNRFILSASQTAATGLPPVDLVVLERRMQLFSALLSCSALLGMAFCYRNLLLPGRPQRAASSAPAPRSS